MVAIPLCPANAGVQTEKVSKKNMAINELDIFEESKVYNLRSWDKKNKPMSDISMQEACYLKPSGVVIFPKILHSYLLPLLIIFIMFGSANATKSEAAEKKISGVGIEANDSPEARRAKREAEFQNKIKNQKHKQAPTAKLSTVNRSGPEAGFGVKTEGEIEQEKERKPRIAILGPLTGELQKYGHEALEGVELASEELDAKGGVKGNEYELLVLDTKGSIASTQRAITALLDYDTLAIVGAGTGEVSFAANKFINENQLIKLSAGSRRRLGDTGPYNFRNTLDDTTAIKGVLDYIKKHKKWHRFGIFSSVVDDYSIKLSAAYKIALLNAGMTVSHELFFWGSAMSNIGADESSIEAQVKLLKKDPPDALAFAGSVDEAVEILTRIKEAGLNIPLIASEDIVDPDFIALGELAVGTLIHAGFNADSKKPVVKRFVSAFTKKFHHTPGRLSALAYDSFNMIIDAVKRAPSLRPSHVRQALVDTKNFIGVTGPTSVNEVGESSKSPFILEFRKQGDGYGFVSVKEPF